MVNLIFRSVIVLALLFGLLFAVGMAVVVYFGLPAWTAAAFALGVLLLQYLLGPFLLEWIYKIRWEKAEQVDPALASFLRDACAREGLPAPRFGIIEDGNPNAFTFGHYPADARLVVTRGLIDLLDEEERQAVVAHELGHIAHWDFVVMTIAAAVPLLLYVLYITSRRVMRGGGGRKRGQVAAVAGAVALLSYLAYVISQYIVLLLSRVREYFADQFAGRVTGNPGRLGTALVKVAYGLAAAPRGPADKKDDSRMVAGRSFGIFDPKVASALALAGAGSGHVSLEATQAAMKWDLWNPWALFYELSSSHPLPAKRIRALERQAGAMGRPVTTSFQQEQPESFWDEFLVDVAFQWLPALGFLAGTGAGLVLVASGYPLAGVGLLVLAWGISLLVHRRFAYPPIPDSPVRVKDLVGEVKVSAVRAIPGRLEGKIIGRGVPGLFYSEDLVLQDSTGFIVVDYRQPLRFLEFLFGLFKAEGLIGRSGRVQGWFRRAPRPYFELRRMTLDGGEQVVSYSYPLAQFTVYAMCALGALALLVQFLLPQGML